MRCYMAELKEKYYLGNKKLPVPEVEQEFDEFKIKELAKSSEDIVHFATQYFFITTLGRGKEVIELYTPQRRVLKNLVKNRFNIILASRQSGKALDLDTKIHSPNGLIRMGDIKSGDIIYSDTGELCNVVHAHEILHNRPCYKLIFDTGEEIVADEGHLWFTQTLNEKRTGRIGSKKTTKDIYESLTVFQGKKQPNHRIPSYLGIKGEHKKLILNPYVYGCWLGDGCRYNPRIVVGEQDKENLIYNLKTVGKLKDDNITVSNKIRRGVYNIQLKGKDENNQSYYGIFKSFNTEKRIPYEYMTASREQRLDLLRGLMDTDGSLSGYSCTFYNTENPLIDDFCMLLSSLGIKHNIHKRKNFCNDKQVKDIYRINFSCSDYVFLLKRKRDQQKLCTNIRSKYVYIKNIVPVESRPVRCITVDSPSSLFLCGNTFVPTSNTTIMTVYALWETCFKKDKRVLIVANKEDTAKMILRRIKMAYEQLPNWLKPGVKQWDKTEVIFENDSSIAISTTTSSAARGESINCLIVDEMAHIPEHIVQEFWNAVIPVISSYSGTKVFITSTPNGTGNKFHEIYSKTERGEMEEWSHDRIDYWEIPGRGKKWKETMMQLMAKEQKSFDQEFGNQFLETGQSAVDSQLLDHFRAISKPPLEILEDGAYRIWEYPNPQRLYVVGVDVGEGIGQNASVAQVLDVSDLTNIKQVACYHNNLIDPFHFAGFLYKLTGQWGMPYLYIERNNSGGQVIDALKEVHNYNNIADYSTDKLKYFDRLGIYSHTNSKYEGIMNMRYWINSLKVVELYDIATTQELESFVRYPNGTWKAKAGDYVFDDRVMSLVWALFSLEPKMAQKYYDVESFDTQGKPMKIQPISMVESKYFKIDDMFRSADSPLPSHILTKATYSDEEGVEGLMYKGWQFADKEQAESYFGNDV